MSFFLLSLFLVSTVFSDSNSDPADPSEPQNCIIEETDYRHVSDIYRCDGDLIVKGTLTVADDTHIYASSITVTNEGTLELGSGCTVETTSTTPTPPPTPPPECSCEDPPTERPTTQDEYQTPSPTKNQAPETPSGGVQTCDQSCVGHRTSTGESVCETTQCSGFAFYADLTDGECNNSRDLTDTDFPDGCCDTRTCLGETCDQSCIGRQTTTGKSVCETTQCSGGSAFYADLTDGECNTARDLTDTDFPDGCCDTRLCLGETATPDPTTPVATPDPTTPVATPDPTTPLEQCDQSCVGLLTAMGEVVCETHQCSEFALYASLTDGGCYNDRDLVDTIFMDGCCDLRTCLAETATPSPTKNQAPETPADPETECDQSCEGHTLTDGARMGEFVCNVNECGEDAVYAELATATCHTASEVLSETFVAGCCDTRTCVEIPVTPATPIDSNPCSQSCDLLRFAGGLNEEELVCALKHECSAGGMYMDLDTGLCHGEEVASNPSVESCCDITQCPQ